MRVVLDPNVLISAALSPTGAPAELIRRWLAGEYELLVSPALISELARVLNYPKIAKRIDRENATALLNLLKTEAHEFADLPEPAGVEVGDSDDTYLVALAVGYGAAVVSGDRHLTDLAGRLPIYSPADFLLRLDRDRQS